MPDRADRKGSAFPKPGGGPRPQEDHYRLRDERPAPAGAGVGAGRGLWPPAGQGVTCRGGRGDGPCHRSGEGVFVGAGRNRKRTAFPPPVRHGSPQTGRSMHTGRPAPDPAGEKRPPGAGRALAGGFRPPAGVGSAGRCGRGDGPCHSSGVGVSDSDLPAPLRAGTGSALRFPRPPATLPPRPVPPAPTAGQRPTRRARSARQGRGGRWPGALGPRRAWGQRGAVARAIAPANAAMKVLSSARAGPGNAARFPARAERFPADRQVQA